MPDEVQKPISAESYPDHKILRGASIVLRTLIRRRSKGGEMTTERHRQIQMFGPDVLNYAKQNPASQEKIEEFVRIVKTLTGEKDDGQHPHGSSTRVMQIKAERQEHPRDAIIVEYNRGGTLEDADIQRRIGSPIVAVKGLGFNVREFRPGELDGFGPKHGSISDSLLIYGTQDPNNPHRVVYGRKVEDLRGQMFSEYLHDGSEKDQSVIESERQGTDGDIENVMKELMAAAVSEQTDISS